MYGNKLHLVCSKKAEFLGIPSYRTLNFEFINISVDGTEAFEQSGLFKKESRMTYEMREH